MVDRILLNGRTECCISHYSSLDSTNSALKEMAENGAPSWTVVIADGQTNGYGRFGRSFDSKSGTGLYMSILLRFDIGFDPATLTPAVAVATALPVERISGKAVRIKWVNDLLIDNRKVCGILTEATSAGGSLKYAILGIGVNIYREGGFSDDLKSIAGVIYDSYSESLRDELAYSILSELERLLAEGNETVYKEYRNRLAFVDDRVRVIGALEEYDATVIGLDPDFRLVVRHSDGRTERLFSGEIAIKHK